MEADKWNENIQQWKGTQIENEDYQLAFPWKQKCWIKTQLFNDIEHSPMEEFLINSFLLKKNSINQPQKLMIK